MKLLGAVAVLVAGTGAWASEPGQRPNHLVMVCLNYGVDAMTFFQGEAAATQVLKQAGIRLEWRSAERDCTGGNGLVVTVSHATPTDLHPGALAYALPFEGTHIVVFYDRVLDSVCPNSLQALLGHVLAHEIVHMLQGTSVHSAIGIMKEHWNSQDFADMRRGSLKFTQDDLDLIDEGFAWRSTQTVRPGDRAQYHN